MASKSNYVLDDYGYRITKAEAARREESDLKCRGWKQKYPDGTKMLLNCAETDMKDELVTIDSDPFLYGHHQMMVKLKERRGTWCTKFLRPHKEGES